MQTERRSSEFGVPINSNLENLVLWARSEKIGYAEDKCRGIMGSEG
jgi:hypothetical protein